MEDQLELGQHQLFGHLQRMAEHWPQWQVLAEMLATGHEEWY